MDFDQIQQENSIIQRIGRIKNPFYPEEVTAKYLILSIDIIGLLKGEHAKREFIRHLLDNHLPTMETVEEFTKRLMNEHTWINSHLSRLAGEYAASTMGTGSKGARLAGRAVIRWRFLQMAIGEAIGLRFFYKAVARLNNNFNSVMDLEYDDKMSGPGLVVIRKRTRPHYRERLVRDFGQELSRDAMEMDDEVTKGVLESFPRAVNVGNELAEVIHEPFCELRGDDFCEYHIRVKDEAGGFFPFIKGCFRSLFSYLLFTIPMVRKMGEQLVALEITIHQQTRNLTESQISLEERVMERTRALRTLNTHLVLTEERERKRVADNLHEGLGQELAISRILASQLSHEHPESSGTIEQLKSYIDQMIAKTRDMTNDLSPPVLHELGLPDALIWLGDKIREDYGTGVEVDIDPLDFRLVPDTEIMLFRMAQELMVNSVKHAEADLIGLTFNSTGKMLRLIVEDNGKGFNPESLNGFSRPENACFGLYSIRDRIRYAGGRFSLESSPGQGCKVTLLLPGPDPVQPSSVSSLASA